MPKNRFAELETRIDEFNSRCIASSERKEYLNCFLTGVKTEAKTMLRFAEYAQMLDLLYAGIPTILAPFRDSIQNRISVDLGSAFSSAKGVSDNLNRFVQAFYLPENIILERKAKMDKLRETKTDSEAMSSVYPLDKLKLIADLNPQTQTIADLFKEFHEQTSWVRDIRNTADHGCKHLLVERDKKGFYLSGDLVSEEAPEENQYVMPVLDALQNGYVGLANIVLNEALKSDNGILRSRNNKDGRLYLLNKAKHNAEWLTPFLVKYTIIPSVAIGLTFGLIDLNQSSKVQKHKDERTINQLRELSAFQREVIETNRKVQKFTEAVDHLAMESQVMLAYTNRPADFDAEKVTKILEKLKKTAETLRRD